MRSMKNLIYVVSAVCLLSVIACKTSNVSLSDQNVKTSIGEDFNAKNIVSYDDLLMKMEGKEKMNDIVVEGKVAAVCQMKGCWMNVVSEKDDNAPEMFVQFKDYGFFMPKDLGGGKIVMKGNAYKAMTSVEELKHFAEDEGKSPAEIAKITEPKVELKFMASGVKILN